MNAVRTLSRRFFFIALAIGCPLGSTARAAEPSQVTIQKVLTNLNDPRGVAIRPDAVAEKYELFVAESGAGQVVKVTSDMLGKSTDAITGFSTSSPSDKNRQAAGVLSLQFLDHLRLVVAGGDDDGTPFVRLYELADTDVGITADQQKQNIGLPVGKEPHTKSQPFPCITRSQPNDRVGDVLIIPGATDSNAARLVIIPVRASTLGDAVPVRIVGANNELEIGGIAMAKSGHIVVGGRPTANNEQSGVLEFVNPLDRHVVMQVPIELGHIVALAYSPKSGNLYAANSPAADDGHAGVYRIDAASEPGSPTCKAVKIADVRSPTSLAFAPDGALFVTALNDSTDTESDKGTLLKLTGQL